MRQSDYIHINRFLALSLMLFFLYPLASNAQSDMESDELYPFSSDWYLTPNAGLTVFYGDLSKGFPLANPDQFGIGYGINLGKRINSKLDFRLQFLAGGLHGRDDIENFDNSFFEYNLGVVVRISEFFMSRAFCKENLFYTQLSIGYIQWVVDKYNLQSGAISGGNGHEGNGAGINGRTLQGMLALGFGYQHDFNKKFSFNAEMSFTGSNTDIMDATIASGGFLKNDWFQYISVGVNYRFDFKNKDRTKTNAPELANLYFDNQRKAKIIIDTLTSIKLDPTEASLSCTMPDTISPGETTKIKLMLAKGALKGKCQITGLIPSGYQVLSSNSDNNTNFIAEGRDIFIQTDRPSSRPTILYTFDIKTDTAKGGEKSVFFTGNILDENGLENKFHVIHHFYQEQPLLLESGNANPESYQNAEPISKDTVIFSIETEQIEVKPTDSSLFIQNETHKLISGKDTIDTKIPDSTAKMNLEEINKYIPPEAGNEQQDSSALNKNNTEKAKLQEPLAEPKNEVNSTLLVPKDLKKKKIEEEEEEF